MPDIKNYLKKITEGILSWFRRTFELPVERREEVLGELRRASSPGFDYFFLVVLSCIIATLGLITDSTAVIIGAMLVAPLMSPILGLSLASIAGAQRMFRRAALALLEGVVLAITLSMLVSWASRQLPFGILDVLPHEVLARTRPTPFDLGIALAGGAAAAYALAQPRISAALPGVAIATALMPPVCTVGVGLALRMPEVSGGAFLLFVTNLLAISFAGIVVFAVLGFRPISLNDRIFRIPRSLLISAVLVLIVTIPLVFFSLQFVAESQFTSQVHQAIDAELENLSDAQLVDVVIGRQGDTLSLLVTIRASRQPLYNQLVALQRGVASRLQQPVEMQLIVIPATRLDPLIPPTPTLTFTPGPSLTPTITPTSTATPTATATVTVTPTSTSTVTTTPTVTQTPTSTPVLATIGGTGGVGVALRETPAGAIIGFLPEGTPVQILYRREVVGRFDWLEVRDLLGRTGWVLANFLVVKP